MKAKRISLAKYCLNMEDVLDVFRDRDSNFNVRIEQPGPSEIIIKSIDEEEIQAAVQELQNYAQVR